MSLDKPIDYSYFSNLDIVERLRLSLQGECTCAHFGPCDNPWISPNDHNKSCPMSNPENKQWDYIYWYDYPFYF